MLPWIAMLKAFIKVNNQCSCIEAFCLTLIGSLLCGVCLHSSSKKLTTKAIRQVSMVAVLLLLFSFVTQTVSKYSLCHCLMKRNRILIMPVLVRKLVFGCNSEGGHTVSSDFLLSSHPPSETGVPFILLPYDLSMTFGGFVLYSRDKQN